MIRTALLLPLLLLAPQDKGLKKLEFKLPPGRVAEYSILDRAGKPDGDRSLLVFGSELTPSSNRFVVDRFDELPLLLAFQLPAEAFKGGIGWEFSADYFSEAQDAAGGWEAFLGGAGLRPVHIRGRYIVKPLPKKAEDELFSVDGVFTFYEIRRTLVNNQAKFALTKNDLGTLSLSVQFSASRGLPLKAGWQLKLKGQEREGGRVVDRKFDVHVQIALKEDRDLDPAAVRTAAEAAVARALTRLKAMQKPDGSWIPERNAVPRNEAVASTAQVVRALLAAGLPASDSVFLSASRILKSPAPPETAGLAQQVLALAGKDPDKDEAEHARKLGEELLKRRDPRTGAWNAGGRNDAANLSVTQLALEALAACPGLKVPEEVWKTALDTLLASMLDEDEELTLDLAFTGDAPILPDPKQAKAAGWPAQLGPSNDPMDAIRPRGRGRGTAITTVGALRAIDVCAGKLTLDEKSRQGLDAARRRGLLGLQRRWTLRTVPPAEGSWSGQRLEHLGQLGPLFSRYTLEKIAGSDWRTEGALMLLREQSGDGSWQAGTENAAAKTAHALLFLGAVLK